MLSSCAGNNIDYYKGTTPQADIREYFNGPVKAWGIVQDWRGRVVRRFDVDMVGTWDGDVGTLIENFNYYDGKTQQRVWTITKQPDGSYTGTASDIIDKASGVAEGSAVRWNYVMDLPVGDKVYRIRFDDWMWVMNDGVLINRSYLKKFGVTVSELTIFMQKQAQ
ncbi:DUF3833 domain-containing protein [Micavibrio aeruginosavorus]|uniref:Lipoprotein n=1 Tax=Micavibrio aeruginosavorus EPB TaxID=349215 RepID=M4VJN4_9BACT|nr:DUF3833 domain-containing protein [Micavibrio aeruginosavorus]AGH98705.1 hypothetical protein A11S_1904 [Micavibrio aeruginosavorus EPB]